MRKRYHSALLIAFGAALLMTFTGAADATSSSSSKTNSAKKAQATRPVATSVRGKSATQATSTRVSSRGNSATRSKSVRHSARSGRGGGLSCVPYARSVTGMAVSGNAWQWWGNAAGTYARGQVPEAGSVLAFRNNMRMPMGHVAVVSRVESARVVTIDHANWPIGGRRGMVARGVAVVDVSERNDWSAVRVALGPGSDFGSIYPTHGFIYNRPDRDGTIRLTSRAPAPMLALNTPPRDLRSLADRNRARQAERAFVEVAEAPETTVRPQQVPVRAEFEAPVRPYAVTLPSGVYNGGN